MEANALFLLFLFMAGKSLSMASNNQSNESVPDSNKTTKPVPKSFGEQIENTLNERGIIAEINSPKNYFLFPFRLAAKDPIIIAITVANDFIMFKSILVPAVTDQRFHPTLEIMTRLNQQGWFGHLEFDFENRNVYLQTQFSTSIHSFTETTFWMYLRGHYIFSSQWKPVLERVTIHGEEPLIALLELSA